MRGGFQGAGRAAWLSAVGLGAAGAGLWAEGLAADEAGRSAVPPPAARESPALPGRRTGSVGWVLPGVPAGPLWVPGARPHRPPPRWAAAGLALAEQVASWR